MRKRRWLLGGLLALSLLSGVLSCSGASKPAALVDTSKVASSAQQEAPPPPLRAREVRPVAAMKSPQPSVAFSTSPTPALKSIVSGANSSTSIVPDTQPSVLAPHAASAQPLATASLAPVHASPLPSPIPQSSNQLASFGLPTPQPSQALPSVGVPTAVETTSAREGIPSASQIVPPTVLPSTILPIASPSREDPKITGQMQINFGSRSVDGGIDTYELDLKVADALRVKGKITRQGRVLSRILGREQQPQQLQYALALYAQRPGAVGAETRLATLTGTAPISSAGVYDLSKLKLEPTLASALQVNASFGGLIRGRAEAQSGLLARSYSRIVGGRSIALKIARVDPLRFERLLVPAGPLTFNPQLRISGNLDYDYDTGNWLTSAIEMRSADGEVDTFSGSIKWVPDANRDTNGKGQYEFNLRVNEERYTKTADESDFFEGVEDETAFFASNEAIPAIQGLVRYRDSFGPREVEGEPEVLSSVVQYQLEGRKLTLPQLINFLKLWLLLVGPVNDE